jgi:hypothetical protein
MFKKNEVKLSKEKMCISTGSMAQIIIIQEVNWANFTDEK